MAVEIKTSEAVLSLRVTGADQLFGLRSRLEVPMEEVIGARTLAAKEAKSDLWIRTGGLGLPGVATVGHFRGREAKKQWWRVYRASEVLVIDLAPKSRFDRLVLQVDRPERTAARINNARGAE